MRNTGSEKKVAMPADAKLVNRQMVMNVLRSGRVVTAADIHEETGISRPTAMRTLQHYCEKGVAKSLGLGESTNVGGKKPELFQFSDERKILCINFWPEVICLGMCSLIGDIEHMRMQPAPKGISLEEMLATLEAVSFAYLEENGLTKDDLVGVMLSVPGTVDYDRRMLRYNIKSPGWGVNIMLGDQLERIFGEGKEYFVGNAGKSMGRAILIDEPAYSQRRVMTLFTAWGVSACMIVRGHVLNGRDSLIGEIGHMIVSGETDVTCACGKRGCLESLITRRHVREMMRRAGAAEALCQSLTIPGLFERSASGDACARQVVKQLARYLAAALHNLSLCYNQEVVVIQGEYAWADELFDKTLKAELSQFRYYPQEPFAIEYDRRNIELLSLRGGAEVIKKKYFASLD